jgi:hypothetical protein
MFGCRILQKIQLPKLNTNENIFRAAYNTGITAQFLYHSCSRSISNNLHTCACNFPAIQLLSHRNGCRPRGKFPSPAGSETHLNIWILHTNSLICAVVPSLQLRISNDMDVHTIANSSLTIFNIDLMRILESGVLFPLLTCWWTVRLKSAIACNSETI